MNISPSSRLNYALMTEKDEALMFQLDQDPEVMRYISAGRLNTRKEIRDLYIPRMESYTKPEKGWGLWKVSLSQSEEFIGWILVRPEDYFSDNPNFNNLELGWRFARNFWGKGYATEAARTIQQALMKAGVCTQLSALAVEENQASINIMLKLGMKYINTGINTDPLGNDEVVVYYRMDI